ncbi:DUF4328 domain-containing protein [Streptomyces sp. NPDC056144]|uniref:DUF4328 domain-containing protein n=1 Tax=unclassified Streptomyces TaxID=2593676 RepID=UPI0035DCA131
MPTIISAAARGTSGGGTTFRGESVDQYNVPVGPAAVRGPRYRFRNPAGPAFVVQSLFATQAITDVYVMATGGSRSPWSTDFGAEAGALQIACWVAFLFWFYRVRCNAEVLAPGSHKYSPAFALGAWVVPLAMWWLPRRITLDIRRAGGPPVDVWLINAWWAVWLLDGPVSVLVHYLVLRHYDYGSPMDLVLSVVDVVLAIAVVRRVTADQPAGPLPYFNMT